MLSILAPYLLAVLGSGAALWLTVRWLEKWTDDWLDGDSDA